MRHEVTLDTLQQTAVDLQSGGRNFSTVLGLALVVAVAVDAYLVALGQASITGFLLELTTLRIPYRVGFFITLVLQGGVLFLGFRALRNSRWRSSVSQSALAPLWASVRAGRAVVLGPHVKDNAAVVAAVFAVALLVAGVLVWALLGALAPGELSTPLRRWGLLGAMLVLALLLAAVLATLAVVCLVDLQAAIGTGTGLLLAAVAAAYATGSARADGGPSDLVYWETGVFAIAVVGMLIFMRGSRSSKIVLVLNIPDGAACPLFREYNPFSSHIIRPASLMFQVHGTKLLAFSRTERAGWYEIIDTRDEQLATPLHDRSIKFLNVSSLASQVRTSFDVTDTGGCFALRGSVGLLSTIASYAQGTSPHFDRKAVELITDALFTNEDLHGLLVRPVSRALEKHVAPMRAAIADIRATINQLPEAMSLGDSGTAYTATLRAAVEKERSHVRHDALQGASRKRDGKQQLGSAFLQLIDQKLAEFNQIRASMESYTSSFPDVWVAEILEELRQLTQSHALEPATLHEASRLLNVLGLRLNDLRLELVGPAAQCQAELASLRGEIEKRFKEAEAQYERQSEKRDDLLGDIAKKLTENPSLLRPADIAALLASLSTGGAVPAVAQPPAPPPQVDFDLDLDPPPASPT